MAKATILVVEDESIVAVDLQQRLHGMGYSVPAVAATSQDALRKAAETRPDLVLMDIRLKGYVDGIEVAEKLREMLDVPPVYLTAYADQATLARAKTTEPFGYIVKPFDDETLHRTIEMALFRRSKERQLRHSAACLKTILHCVNDSLIAADERCHVTLMNPAAEALTGWKQDEALGRDLPEVFQVVGGATGTDGEGGVRAVWEKGVEVTLAGCNLRVHNGGDPIPITAKAAPIVDDLGIVTGAVIAFRRAAGNDKRRLTASHT
jgi:CheY-like chemotaxis protein